MDKTLATDVGHPGTSQTFLSTKSAHVSSWSQLPIPTPIHLVTSYQIVLVNLPAHEAEPGHRNILAMWPGGRGRDDHANDRLRRRAGAPERADLAEQNSSYGLCQVYADICVCWYSGSLGDGELFSDVAFAEVVLGC